MRQLMSSKSTQRGFIHLIVIAALGVAAVVGYQILKGDASADPAGPPVARTSPATSAPGPVSSAQAVSISATNPRVRISLVQVLDDPTVEGHRRGVYLVTDTKTGQEYIGVSGLDLTPVARVPNRP